ncbi:MAG: TetR/AcrR family transcriptional regulator [Clostridiales bacterium]|nr:TetR/AcrR family transcriptional regulator [Clostridiales bacterium]
MSENQRVRLSKQLLRQSLIKLLGEKSIHKVSVREICEQAQVNRSTFYKYYGSQYDLFHDMEEEILAHVNNYLRDEPSTMTGDLSQITKLVAFIGENAELCRIIINHNIDPKFPEALVNLPSLHQWIDTHFRVEYSKNEMEYVYGLVVNGGFSIIRMWLNKENPEPPDVVAEVLCATIAKLFPAAV